MRYDLILFDADGTLFDFHRAEREAIRTTFADFSLEFEPELHGAIYTEVNHAIWKEFEKGLISGEDLAHERFRRYFVRLTDLGDLSRPVADVDAGRFAEGYLRRLGEGAYLLPGAQEIVELLREHARLAIITNGFAQVQRSRFSRTAMVRHFEEVFISGEMGSQKPSPEYFEAVFDRFSDVPANRMLIVGDSLSSDIRGGQNVGVDTCWFNPERQSLGSASPPTYHIQSLAEIAPIVFDAD